MKDQIKTIMNAIASAISNMTANREGMKAREDVTIVIVFRWCNVESQTYFTFSFLEDYNI